MSGRSFGPHLANSWERSQWLQTAHTKKTLMLPGDLNHKNIYVGKDLEVIKSSHQPDLLNPRRVCTSLKYLQGWGLLHLPGQPFLMPGHSLFEEILPDMQSNPPLVRPEVTDSCPIICHLRNETSTLPTVTSFQALVGSSEVSSQPPQLQI